MIIEARSLTKDYRVPIKGKNFFHDNLTKIKQDKYGLAYITILRK